MSNDALGCFAFKGHGYSGGDIFEEPVENVDSYLQCCSICFDTEGKIRFKNVSEINRLHGLHMERR